MASPYLAWAVIFIVVPLAMVIYYGVTDTSGAFTFDNIAMVSESGYFKALYRSIALAFISTVICFLLAYPLGMILASMKLTRN
ncbi:MAG: hypothetical protein J6O49_02055, partial [Bacteroidaceae bacterium]|nr:hypothetical protein [Bacteroidaceae bacterium]